MGLLLAGRVIHPFGLDYDVAQKPAQIVGALATGVVTPLASGFALYSSWRAGRGRLQPQASDSSSV